MTLTLQGVVERYPFTTLRQWSVFERTLGAPVVGIQIETADVARPHWSIPLSDIEQARACVHVLDQLKDAGTQAAFSAESR
ncbi:MAG: hypothetical protein WDN30_10220 [Pararobbsia sp.]